MGASQRRKGRAFEQLIARSLRSAGIECRRGRQGEGAVEPDIVVTRPPTLGSIIPWIECGHGARMDLVRKYEQARRQSRYGTTPIAVVRRDRGPILAMLTVAGLIACVGYSRAAAVRVRLPEADEAVALAVVLQAVESVAAIGDVPVTVEWQELVDALRCE